VLLSRAPLLLLSSLRGGSADFDAQFLLRELPGIMGIEDRRVRMLLKELVGARK